MSDIVNQTTGEVVSREEADFAIKKADELRDFRPTNPVEMEFFIREANGVLEKMPSALLEINERRYAAERAYSARKNTQMAFYGRQGMQISFARAQAEVDALPELEVWHGCKAEYHYAEDTAKALTTKVNSMLNINKHVNAQYGSYR
ncbi:hypothetical protein [uncultured Microbacterium sp.]|uniref:hypothetical protein n=1 Tax=uncultured Microbacterium sp. TaxID=191216 RepID=UPI0025E11197|nr:hypothetical protein [uncultured Microbacterium sp.]